MQEARNILGVLANPTAVKEAWESRQEERTLMRAIPENVILAMNMTAMGSPFVYSNIDGIEYRPDAHRPIATPEETQITQTIFSEIRGAVNDVKETAEDVLETIHTLSTIMHIGGDPVRMLQKIHEQPHTHRNQARIHNMLDHETDIILGNPTVHPIVGTNRSIRAIKRLYDVVTIPRALMKHGVKEAAAHIIGHKLIKKVLPLHEVSHEDVEQIAASYSSGFIQMLDHYLVQRIDAKPLDPENLYDPNDPVNREKAKGMAFAAALNRYRRQEEDKGFFRKRDLIWDMTNALAVTLPQNIQQDIASRKKVKDDQQRAAIDGEIYKGIMSLRETTEEQKLLQAFIVAKRLETVRRTHS